VRALQLVASGRCEVVDVGRGVSPNGVQRLIDKQAIKVAFDPDRAR